MAEVNIDRRALKELVTGLRKPGREGDWCVACGAGAASSKLDYPSQLVEESGKQFLDASTLREFVGSIRDMGEQAWCVACGAGAASSPLDRVLPENIDDAFIDQLANRLVTTVRVK
jgi:hypothetical protein